MKIDVSTVADVGKQTASEINDMTDEQHKQWCKDIAENKQLKVEIEGTSPLL
ncbi:hypothetical protein LCGC14_1644580, partial [marine sediment metagenome]